MFVLSVVAFAGETQSPPCAPPDPGETQSPPCAAAQMTPNESVAPGANAPPASDTGNAFSVTEVALDLLQGVLLLF